MGRSGWDGGGDGDDGRLADLLRAWAGDVAADDAAAARARQRWLSTQAEEGATLAGSLVDVAEAGTVVALRGPEGSWTGRVGGVGTDFCVLEPGDAPPLLVALGAVAVVAPVGPVAPDGPAGGRGLAGTGDRPGPIGLDMAGALAALAADRAPVRLHLRGGTALTAVLRSVGADVAVAVPLAGDRRSVLVALDAVVAAAPG